MPNDPVSFTSFVASDSGGDDNEIIGDEIIFSTPFSRIAPIGRDLVGIDPETDIEVYTAAGEMLTYVSDLDDAVDSFTIVDISGALDSDGEYIYYNDKSQTDANGTGQLCLIFRVIA